MAVRLAVEHLEAGELLLDRAGSHYLIRVHRLGPADPFVVFDPAARMEAEAVIAAIEGGRARVRIGAGHAASRVAHQPWVVVQCAAKGDKLAQVVRHATELGAAELCIAVSDRSVRRPSAQQLARWRRIALHAARQCGRGDVPSLAPPAPLEDVLGALAARPGAWCRLLLEPSAPRALSAALRAAAPTAAVAVVVGPEGGFSDQERQRAVALGFEAVRFGAFVVRTETACAAVLGALIALREAGPRAGALSRAGR